MTSVMEEAAMPDAINAGAIAYALRIRGPQELRRAILCAKEGQVVFASETVERLTAGLFTSDEDPATLAPADIQLLKLIARGKSNGQIATILNQTVEEVRAAVQALLTSLHIAGRGQAVLYAVGQRIVPASEVPSLCPTTSIGPSPYL